MSMRETMDWKGTVVPLTETNIDTILCEAYERGRTEIVKQFWRDLRGTERVEMEQKLAELPEVKTQTHWTELLKWVRDQNRQHVSECNGLCVTAADIGVGNYDQIAYPHPMCPQHGDVHQFEWSGKTHDTHDGLLKLCVCGAY